MGRIVDEITTLMDSLKPGEIVLLLYDESLIPEFAFLFLVKYARNRGMTILVDDILDSLYVVVKHLEYIGVDTSFVNDIFVLKVGGSKRVGKIYEHIKLENVYSEKYTILSRKFYEEHGRSGNILNIVLGFENLFYLTPHPRAVALSMAELASFLGEKSRIAVYMVNKKLMEYVPSNPLPFIERIASTVIYMEAYPRKATLRIGKCSSIDLVGKGFIIEIDDILKIR